MSAPIIAKCKQFIQAIVKKCDRAIRQAEWPVTLR